MKHINIIAENSVRKNGKGCGECQSSCQSACKTSCTVGNQSCQQEKDVKVRLQEIKKPLL